VPPRRSLILAALLLAGCGTQATTQQDLDSLDRELAESGASHAHDPALLAALHDQIMIDPALTQSANTNVVRPPSRPDPLSIPAIPLRPDHVTAADLKPVPAASGDCPECRTIVGALTLGEIARRRSPAGPGGDGCTQPVSYSAGWANRLSIDVPLYPAAQVEEAAGNDACGLRIVRFASAAPAERILGWYMARVTRAGYSAEHQAAGQQHVLAGTRPGAAYIVYVTAAPGGGSDVALLVR